MTLYYRTYGEAAEGRAALIFLHGLFGASSNWGQVVKPLAAHFFCVVPDLRNHGQSFHHHDTSYAAQIEDVLELIAELKLAQVILIGHSMGGKLAMLTALQHPLLIEKLVVVDIAPLAYQHSLGNVVTALQSVPLDRIAKRADADHLLAKTITTPKVRAFLLQNLVRQDGQWRWRINLAALADQLDLIAGFPIADDARYFGPSLFIYGELSPYIKPDGQAAIKHYFPQAQIIPVPGASHWVYADQPQTFNRILDNFLGI